MADRLCIEFRVKFNIRQQPLPEQRRQGLQTEIRQAILPEGENSPFRKKSAKE